MFNVILFLEKDVKNILYAVFRDTVGILDILHSSQTKKPSICCWFPSYYIEMTV